MGIRLIAAQRDETTTKQSMNLLCLGLKSINLSDEKNIEYIPVKDFAVVDKPRSDSYITVGFIRTPEGKEYATRSPQIIEALCLYAVTRMPVSTLVLSKATGKNGDYITLEDITSDETQKAAFTSIN